ncbi:MAG: OsmC family protein [Ignavibacteria bacterium]|nr:OsmC family protein [Ignavibacteria bacterium]
MDTHFYKTNVKWTDGRVGILTEEGMPDVTVTTPPEFHKGVPNIWSPEHLFVASANICLMTTFLAVAENSNLEFVSYTCEGIGKLEKADGKYIISEILLVPTVVIKDERMREKTERILQKSEANCLISRSMKSKIILKTNILVKK